MGGFEEIINFLKDANSGKFNSTNSINSILDKINTAVNAEKIVQNNVSVQQNTKTDVPPRTKKEDKPKAEKQLTASEQKRASSNEVIMKHRAELNVANNDISNFKFELNPDSMVQAVIYSEILNKPVSKRRNGRGQRQRRNW